MDEKFYFSFDKRFLFSVVTRSYNFISFCITYKNSATESFWRAQRNSNQSAFYMNAKRQSIFTQLKINDIHKIIWLVIIHNSKTLNNVQKV